jgi:uncharacterized protein HemX
MKTLRGFVASLLALALVTGAALWLQRQAGEQLREELGLLREENRELVRLRTENRRLTADLPPTEVMAALRADHAAVVRLRGEIAALKASLLAREKALVK